MKILPKLKLKELLKRKWSKNKNLGDAKVSGKLNKNSTVRELLASNEDLSLLLELTKSSNIIFETEWPNLTKLPFQNVHDILSAMEEGNLIEAIEIITGKNNQEIMNVESGIFIKFGKWIADQCKTILALYGKIGEKEGFSKEDVAYQNAGSEKLNRYKEKMIYYSIDKNPAQWPEMEKIPFEVMFTKLLIDKDLSSINKKFTELMSQVR